MTIEVILIKINNQSPATITPNYQNLAPIIVNNRSLLSRTTSHWWLWYSAINHWPPLYPTTNYWWILTITNHPTAITDHNDYCFQTTSLVTIICAFYDLFLVLNIVLGHITSNKTSLFVIISCGSVYWLLPPPLFYYLHHRNCFSL